MQPISTDWLIGIWTTIYYTEDKRNQANNVCLSTTAMKL